MLTPENGWVSETYQDSQDVLIYDEDNTGTSASRTINFPGGARDIYLTGSQYFTLNGNILYFRPEAVGEFSCIISFKLNSSLSINASAKRTGYEFLGKYMEETEGIIGSWLTNPDEYTIQLRITGRGVKPVLSINYIQDENFDFGTVPVNDTVERQAYLYNIGTGDLNITVEQDGFTENVSGTVEGTEFWIQESNYAITQIPEFNIENTRDLLSLIYAPTDKSESFFYHLKLDEDIIEVKGKASRPLSDYGWFNDGDWVGLPGSDFKYILRDITNAIHERERLLGFGEIDEEEPTPIRIATINGTPKSGDVTLNQREVTLTGSCSSDLDFIYVNGLIKGVRYNKGDTTWSWTGLLVDGDNRVVVTGYTKLNIFCFPDEMNIKVDRVAPKITAARTFNINNSLSKVRLKFDEDIEAASLSPDKFSIEPNEILPVNEIDGSIEIPAPTVLSAERLEVGLVELITTKLAEDIRYKIITNGIEDLVNNATSEEEALFIGPVGKPIGVQLAIQFRSGNYSTTSSNLSVTGQCNERGDVRYILVNDTAKDSWDTLVIAPTQRIWSYGVSFISNVTNLIFYEVDLAGAISNPTYLRLIYTGESFPQEFAKPVVTSPSTVSSVSGTSTIVVSGTAESNIVYINNYSVDVVGGNWSYEYSLSTGANQLEVKSAYWVEEVRYFSDSVNVYVEYDPTPLSCNIFSIEYIEDEGGSYESISKYINENGVATFIIKFNKLVLTSSFNPETDLRITGASFVAGSSTSNSFSFNGQPVADTWTVSIQVPLVDSGRISFQSNLNTAMSLNGAGLARSQEFAFFYDKSRPKLHSVRIHGIIVDPNEEVEIDSSGPVDIEVLFTKPLRNFAATDIIITSNANILNFRATRFVETGIYLDKYVFAISPRVTGAKIYMDISPAPGVTDAAGNQVDLDSKGGPYIINYKHPDLDNPWKRANLETGGRLTDEEPFTYWIKPDLWIHPCDPNMVTVYWIRPTLVGKNAKIKGIQSNPTEDYFVGIPMAAMFTERDVYHVTKECDEESADINSTIQEIARVYDLAGGTMTAQMSEFNDQCRYRLHKQEWRVPYAPMGDLINAMRLAIERLVNVGHRKGNTHYISRFCHWVDTVPYRKILNPITMEWEVEEIDYGFWKIWTMEELLLDVNTSANWWDEDDLEQDKAMWVDYTKGHTLNRKIWLQLRDVLNRLTCVKWDIAVCGLPGNCELPFGWKGSVKKFGYNVCDDGWSSLQVALRQSTDQASYYARGGYYPIFDYGYAISRARISGIEYGFVAQVRESVPNEAMAYPDVGWSSGARAITVDSASIPDWSTAYVKGDWVDTWVVAILSAEGITPNTKYLGYSESYYESRQDGRTDDFLYGGCIKPGSGAGFSITEGASETNWSLGGSGVTSGGTQVYDMGWYSSPSLQDGTTLESNACTRSNYTRHQTFDWGGICYARGGRGILNYGEDYPDTPGQTTPVQFELTESELNLSPEVEIVDTGFRTYRREKYPYPFTWQQDRVGGGPFASGGIVAFFPRPSKKVRGHVKFKIVANPQPYGNNLSVPGGAATSFVVTNCLNVLNYRDTTDFENDFCNCKPDLVASRGENGFALDNCAKNLLPGISGADYPESWESFRSSSLGRFSSL